MLGRIPNAFSPSVTDLYTHADKLSRWRAGRIATAQGRLVSVDRRWIGYRASRLRIWLEEHLRSLGQAQCELWYHQPITNANFLVLGYVRSHKQTSLATFYCATLALDEIARLKGCQAIVAEIGNRRLSDRLLSRWGWKRHCESWRGRHFIKRFYDGYPVLSPEWKARLSLPSSGQDPAQ